MIERKKMVQEKLGKVEDRQEAVTYVLLDLLTNKNKIIEQNI